MQVGPVTFREERVLSASECRGVEAFVEFGAGCTVEDEAVPYCRHLRAMVARFTELPELHQELWRALPPRRRTALEAIDNIQTPDNRVYGALLWLHAPPHGAAIYFPALDVHLTPEAGVLALWTLTDAAGEQLEQARAVVLKGDHRALLTWVRSAAARVDPSEEITREIAAAKPRG